MPTRPARPGTRPAAKPGILAAAVAGIALLVSACGGGSPNAAGSAAYQKALPFVQCMRTNGEPAFPDPSSQGIISAPQLSVTPAALQAYGECQRLLPAGDRIQLSTAQRQQLVDRMLKYAGCMRAHGIINFPDPTMQNGRGGIRIGPGSQINPNSPFFQSAQHACAPILGILGLRAHAAPVSPPPPADSGS